QPAAEIADNVVGAAGLELDAGSVAAERSGDFEWKGIEKGVERGLRVECPSGGRAQRRGELRADVVRGERHRQRATGPPESNAAHARQEARGRLAYPAS